VESFVPCSIDKNKSTIIKPSTNSSSNFYKNTPTQSVGRSLPLSSSGHSSHGRHLTVPYPLHFTRTRVSNKYSPLSEHLLDDDDGDGEAWDHSSDDNSRENQEKVDNYVGFYSPAGSNQFVAVQNPPSLNVNEALNWGNMAEEELFQSWEARADAEFEATIAKSNINDECIQLLQVDKSSIMNQHFTPLENSTSPASIQHKNNTLPSSHQKFAHTQSSHSSSSGTNQSESSVSEYIPSPIKTRAQRQRGGTNVLPLHKQKKLSKAAKREASALARLSKSSTTPIRHDPDEYQWQLLLADQKKRAMDNTANTSLQPSLDLREVAADPSDEHSKTWKVCVFAKPMRDQTHDSMADTIQSPATATSDQNAVIKEATYDATVQQ